MSIGGIGQPANSPISRSAMMNATSIAIMNRDPDYARILQDPYAQWFAAAISAEAGATIAALSDPRAVREYIAALEAQNGKPGICTHHVYRKPWVRRHVLAALDAGIEQIVVFGAGLDTLSLRLADRIGTRRVFEIDTPEVIAYRGACIDANGRLPPNVTLLPIDFEREAWRDRLQGAGYEAGARTLFLSEGVMEWLPEEAVLDMFGFVRERAARPSRFIFSFMPPWTISARSLAHIRADNASSGEVFRFTIEPAGIDAFLARQGLRRIDFADPAAFQADVAAAGVPASVLDFLHFVCAQTG
ncbi:MAG: class I SAM-dependent methyltransferase [Gammaproteobacteria bacterium]